MSPLVPHHSFTLSSPKRRLQSVFRQHAGTRPGSPLARVTLLMLLLCANLVPTPNGSAQAAAPDLTPPQPTHAVTPINWGRFTQGLPPSTNAMKLRAIVNNNLKYILNTWWNQPWPNSCPGDPVNPANNPNNPPYPPTGFIPATHPCPWGDVDAAMTLAIALKTGAYDKTVTGVDVGTATAKALVLIRSAVLHHRAIDTCVDGSGLPGCTPVPCGTYQLSPSGPVLLRYCTSWGGDWGSPNIAYRVAFAGWLMWDDLAAEPDTQEMIRRMVEFEANRLITFSDWNHRFGVPYHRERSGRILNLGDTKAEENAWDSTVLALAGEMMPHHPNWNRWRQKGLELTVAAFSRPADVNSTAMLDGRPLKAWLSGSNIENNGLLNNHGWTAGYNLFPFNIAPDYMTAVTHQMFAALAADLAGTRPSPAVRFGVDQVYAALVNDDITSPSYTYTDAPGYPITPTIGYPAHTVTIATTPSPIGPTSSIYVIDQGAPTGQIYYPNLHEKGLQRLETFVLLDTQADAFGFDTGIVAGRPRADAWEGAHATALLAMQGRYTDGHTFAFCPYAPPNNVNCESSSAPSNHIGEEQTVGSKVAQAYLTTWLAYQLTGGDHFPSNYFQNTTWQYPDASYPNTPYPPDRPPQPMLQADLTALSPVGNPASTLDGNYTTYWEAPPGTPPANRYIQYNINRRQVLYQVQIAWNNALNGTPAPFQIQVDEGFDATPKWATVYWGQTGGSSDSSLMTYYISPVLARHIRVMGTEDYRLAVNEFNLVVKGQVSLPISSAVASASDPGYSPAQTIDDLSATKWVHTKTTNDSDVSDTITYSVAPNTVINAVAIGWGKTEDSSNAFYWWTHDIYRFIIEYESAPNVWVAAYVTTSRGAINTPEVYRFETPLTATTGNMRIRTRGLTHVENYNVGPAGGSEQTIYSGPYPHGNRNQITEVEFLQLTTPNPN